MERVGPEIETFVGPEMAMSESSAIRPKKVETEANRDSRTQGVHVRGFPSLAGLVGPVLKNILLPWMVYSVVNLVQDNISLATQAAWRVVHMSLYISSMVFLAKEVLYLFLAATVGYWFFFYRLLHMCLACGCSNQCSGSESGSGSTGSTCFWASRILLWSCKNSKKNLDSYYFVTLFDFLSLKNDVNVPSKSNKQKKL